MTTSTGAFPGNTRYVTSTLPGSIVCADGTRVVFVQPKDDEPGDGPAGVREPRRPRTPDPSTAVARGTS